ncbi:hypothetical protein, partial [Candidatus Avelusimicrobium alvi]|uniref:hypothetical protein n=1 Tax=Candidatus Avelusimicrobium alvi TaxID=3416221 RepID=UPI003D10DBA1
WAPAGSLFVPFSAVRKRKQNLLLLLEIKEERYKRLVLFFFFDKLGEDLLGRIPSHTSFKLFSPGIFRPFPSG